MKSSKGNIALIRLMHVTNFVTLYFLLSIDLSAEDFH